MIASVDELAIFGGSPLFAEPLHVGAPNLPPRQELDRLIDGIYATRRLTNHGPLVQRFEQEVCGLTGTQYCVATCSGTKALEVTARALELSGEVIVPAFTFAATAHALRWQGITPVLCDIEDSDYCINPDRVAALITPRTSAILGVHLWGRTCRVDALRKIADRHSLRLFFDASHALGCSDRNRMVGGFGDAEVFSFHATKVATCGEGGAVVTNDPVLARRLRQIINFGFTGMDRVDALGTNGKLSELGAAMGLATLSRIDTVVAVNHANFDAYRSTLGDIPGISIARFDPDSRTNYQYVSMMVDGKNFGLGRDELMDILRHEGVLVRRYFYPGLHRMAPYSESGHAALPCTEAVAARVLCLPTGAQLDGASVQRIGDLIGFCHDNRAAISERLARRDETR